MFKQLQPGPGHGGGGGVIFLTSGQHQAPGSAAAAGIIMLHFYPLPAPAPAAACTVASFTAHNTINIGRISQHFICSVINFPAGLPGLTLWIIFKKKFAPNQTIVHCALLGLHPGVAACCHVCGGEKLKIINRAIISSRGSGWRSLALLGLRLVGI